MPKKVLIVCYYWPPAGGPGVQRWLKFINYLPEFDIEPIVYVPENPSYPLVDKNIEQELRKDITVIKKPIKEPYGKARLLSRKQTQNISSGIILLEKKQSLLQRMLLYIRGNFFIPDARVGWVKPSIEFLSGFIIENQIDTIITTGPPHSLHLIGKGIKEKYPLIRWVADFRDPWTTIGYHDKLKLTNRNKKRHLILEKEVLQKSDHIIVTSPKTKEEFNKKSQTPITVITNGYDRKEATNLNLSKHFKLSHIGTLLSDRNPILLWKVLSDLIQSNPKFKKSFKLELAGKISQDVLDAIERFGLTSHCEIKGYVSHKEALILQEEASLLLLVEIDAINTQSIIPGKLFEYLAARRPILALGPEKSDIKQIIEETNSGEFFDYGNKNSLKSFITREFDGYLNGTVATTKGAISQYHRKNLTEKLSKLLKA